MTTENVSFLQSIDAFPKFTRELRVKTASGALVSLLAIFLIGYLVLVEFERYNAVTTEDHLIVDGAKPDKKLRIDFDVTFPRIPCNLLSVDAMDVSGEQLLDVSHHITKQRLDKNGNLLGDRERHVMSQDEEDKTKEGIASMQEAKQHNKAKDPNYCGSCYGAEEKPGDCCNSCDDVRLAYRNKGWSLDALKKIEQCVDEGETNEQFQQELDEGEGCHMSGYVRVLKVSGNIHFAPGKSFKHAQIHVHDLAGFESSTFNLSHTVNQLRFGKSYPGAKHLMNGVNQTIHRGGGMFMYYTKVVPTSYEYLNGTVLRTNQFSVTQHYRYTEPHKMKKGLGIPGVFVFYELSPIRVVVRETKGSLPHLITKICAILGGVYTVMGLMDKVVYRGVRRFHKRMNVGEGKLL